MPRINQKTVTVSGEALRRLEERYEHERVNRPTLKFASFIAESALMELDRKNILKEAQYISLVGINDDMVILKDARKNGRFFEVQIRGKKLACITEDNDEECIHVGFALALPEVRKVLANK